MEAGETHAFLGAGERALIDTGARPVAAQPVEKLSPTAVAARLAWRVPSLEFSGTPLDEALPLLNRYRRVRLVLADPALGGVRLSGVLRADNADTLLRLLAEEHGIVAQPRGDTELVLSRVSAP
jgi:transmembrane sensor